MNTYRPRPYPNLSALLAGAAIIPFTIYTLSCAPNPWATRFSFSQELRRAMKLKPGDEMLEQIYRQFEGRK